ncbi:MAG TPA: cyclodeaminase/cyclohydrolase family protein [Chloroflexota bacterium]|nr:cyclodeaminase/cyclohydrolase family protein [Chloroflexota bacterium]
MTIREQPLGAFLEQAASSSPTPGGGALAAVGGALGAAMIAMTARLTEGRKQYEAVQAQVADLAAAADAVRAALLELAEADAAAYEAVMAALRLPRTNEAERTARAAALQTAMIEATNVPAAVVQRCRDVLALAETAAAITNRNALGDVATGAFLAEAAMRAAAVQGELNLTGIADAAFTAAMADELGPAAAGAADRLAAILATVRRRAAERP